MILNLFKLFWEKVFLLKIGPWYIGNFKLRRKLLFTFLNKNIFLFKNDPYCIGNLKHRIVIQAIIKITYFLILLYFFYTSYNSLGYTIKNERESTISLKNISNIVSRFKDRKIVHIDSGNILPIPSYSPWFGM